MAHIYPRPLCLSTINSHCFHCYCLASVVKERSVRGKDKRTTESKRKEEERCVTYIDGNGHWYRVSKGDPEQILNFCSTAEDGLRKKVNSTIEKFAERGLICIAVARQFVGLLPLFDPPRHDSADNSTKAHNHGISVKMMTEDQLATAKETGRRLGLGSDMYHSSSLGQHKESNMTDEVIGKADGFSKVFLVLFQRTNLRLQTKNHVCGMASGAADDVALERADIGIAVVDATDAAI